MGYLEICGLSSARSFFSPLLLPLGVLPELWRGCSDVANAYTAFQRSRMREASRGYLVIYTLRFTCAHMHENALLFKSTKVESCTHKVGANLSPWDTNP